MNSEVLISSLIKQTEESLLSVESFKKLSDKELNKRINENSWSILECLQHLNLYSAFYNKEIYRRMTESDTLSSESFKSGVLGNFFAKTMLPKEKLNFMKTPKSMNPIYTDLDRNVLDLFIKNQKELIQLLEISRTKNLSKIYTNISLMPMIKIRLGDTFRFLVNHNLRHMKQIERILSM